MFRELDDGNSGFVTYDEVLDVVRHKLKKPASVISDDALKAMWVALDVDSSNGLMADEMARFFKPSHRQLFTTAFGLCSMNPTSVGRHQQRQRRRRRQHHQQCR